MQSYLSNPWNNAVSFLEMAYLEQTIGTGSCFFWEYSNRTFLVTNWHNLSGRNPLTGALVSKKAAIPDRVRFKVYRRVSEPDVNGRYLVSYDAVQVNICNGDGSEPKWLEHASLGRKVDIGALDITDAVGGFEVRHANKVEGDAILQPNTAQDVFVIGFPFGLISGAPAPVWKRGTIAIDPTFDIDGLPKMLIDSATREGMSGSVVVARHLVVANDIPKKDGSRSEKMFYAELDLVIGIYSGRHYPDFEKAQLGIVWKRAAIDEVVQAGTAPSVSW